MDYTKKIYHHQRLFLTDMANKMPVLGNLFIEDETVFSANGFVLYSFDKSVIDIEDWMAEHYEFHDSEDITARYFKWDEISETEYIDGDTFGDVLPCVFYVDNINAEKRARLSETAQQVLSVPFELLGSYHTSDLLVKCYERKRRYLLDGNDYYAVLKFPNTELAFQIAYLETALNFPLINICDEISVYVSNDRIKLSTANCDIVIMSWAGHSPYDVKDAQS